MNAEQGIKKSNVIICKAFAAQDVEKAVTVFTDDPWFLAPHTETLKGKDAIKAAYTEMFESGINGLTLSSTDLEQIGDTAFEAGEYTLLVGDTITDRGKYLVVWKHVGDNWLAHRDMINTSLPAPA
ncbi:MAG: nuclear transport factor 2 family protein [Kordiimonadaceae bacterium]|jgi:uncharacterized protein (TIGR02246 family)|nr:nuclear transport factor 2 family protein [Kordiimonadaceae bacterium]MBT6032985.1 nuclear transport factor 2 family protein [Kordiimonadaceae bacterium]